MTKNDRRDVKDSPNATTPSKPSDLPEPPPFDPDFDLIGDMERAERPSRKAPRWVRRLQRRADA